MRTTPTSSTAVLAAASLALAFPAWAGNVANPVTTVRFGPTRGIQASVNPVGTRDVKTSLLPPLAFAPRLAHDPFVAALGVSPVLDFSPSPVVQNGTLSIDRARRIAERGGVKDFDATGESVTTPGRAFFDGSAARDAFQVEVPREVQRTKPHHTTARLKKAALMGAASLAPLLTFAQGEAAKTTSGSSIWVPLAVVGAFALGLFLLLRWSKKNLEAITREEIAAFKKEMAPRIPELMKIPGVTKVEILPMLRMDDTPPAYVLITVDHLGPDNTALLPQRYGSWSPIIAEMVWNVRDLSQSAWVASVDDGGYWPVGIKVQAPQH